MQVDSACPPQVNGSRCSWIKRMLNMRGVINYKPDIFTRCFCILALLAGHGCQYLSSSSCALPLLAVSLRHLLSPKVALPSFILLSSQSVPMQSRASWVSLCRMRLFHCVSLCPRARMIRWECKCIQNSHMNDLYLPTSRYSAKFLPLPLQRKLLQTTFRLHFEEKSMFLFNSIGKCGAA